MRYILLEDRYILFLTMLCVFYYDFHQQIYYKLGGMSYKGINYGRILPDSPFLALGTMANNQNILSINYQHINNSTINKNDIIVQLGNEQVGNDDCICEIRFHVEEPKEDKEDNEEIEAEGEPKEKETAAEKIYKQIVEKAKIGQFAGESIATLLDVNLAVPRGKYTIDFYQKSIRFHGMTFNYTIQYKNITKGFILPMTNESQVSIVLQLNKDKPIYQGQTVYRYIVMQVKKEIQVDIKTKVNPQLIQKAPLLKQLKQEYSGPQFQVFVDLLQATSNIQLIQPGNNYKSKQSQPCVKASVKAQPGWLYMMKQSLIFIPKPVLYFKTDDLHAVEFYRINAANKQFDLKITLKEQKKSVEFLGIERGELDSLVQYFRARQVKVIMQQEPTKLMAEQDEDQSEDQDFEADEESESQSDSQVQQQLGSEQESSSKEKKKKKKEDKQPKGDKGQSGSKVEQKD